MWPCFYAFDRNNTQSGKDQGQAHSVETRGQGVYAAMWSNGLKCRVFRGVTEVHGKSGVNLQRA